jgi:UDP-3-O-[3-hydroxymyristoyl] glucosamine N-acyltransferase
VIVDPGVETPLPSLLSRNPYLAYAKATALLHPQPRPEPGVHPSAQVDATACLAQGVHVGPLAVLGPRVRVGARSVIHAHAVL